MNSKFKIKNPKLKKQSIVQIWIWLTMLFLAFPVTVTAQDVTFRPSINIRGEYDDNVYYTRIFETEDYVTKIKPALTLDYVTERLDLDPSFNVDVHRYADEENLDTEDQHYNINAKYQAMERISISGNGSYTKDTTLESEIEETGLSGNPRQDRDRYTGGMGFTYKISELSDITVNYSHTNTKYEWSGNVDYDVDSIRLSFNSRSENQLDVFTIQPSYYRYDAETSKVDNYSLSIGWQHPFNETLSLTTNGGARYTKTEYNQLLRDDTHEFVEVWNLYTGANYYWNPDTGERVTNLFVGFDGEDSSYSGVADINLKKTGELYSATIGYNQDLSYSSYGEPIDKYKVYCNAEKNITERFKVKFTGNLSLTKSDSKYNDRDSRYYSVMPSISYKITENHSLVLAYLYSQSLDKLRENDPRVDRNRIWLELRFSFPGKLENGRINFDSNSF